MLCFCLMLWPGLGGADELELRRIVSEPHDEHLLIAADYYLLDNIFPKVSRRVCVTASEPPRPVKSPEPGVLNKNNSWGHSNIEKTKNLSLNV